MKLQGVFIHKVIEDLLKLDNFETLAPHICRLANACLVGEEHPYLDEVIVNLHDKLKNFIPETAELTTLEEILYQRGWNP